MKIGNIDREFPHIFWTTWVNSMKFLGKMCFKIILKVTKNQGSTLSIEDKFFCREIDQVLVQDELYRSSYPYSKLTEIFSNLLAIKSKRN